MSDGWLAGLHFAALLERGANLTEFQYGRLRLREAGAQATVNRSIWNTSLIRKELYEYGDE
jgi:hypothetical protein